MQSQLDFTPPLAEEKQSSIYARFQRFHEANPHVYENLVKLAREFRKRGRDRAKSESREPNMPSFADAKNLKPFIDKEFPGGLKTVTFLSKKGQLTQGYPAEVLPSLCEV